METIGTSCTIVKKIVIAKELLSSVNNDLTCTQPGCNKVFKSSSNLDLHLWKSHKIQEKMPTAEEKFVKIQYHCPEAGCKYNLTLGRSFPKAKLLKQHYLQKHAERNFECDNCNTFFATQASKNYHQKTCGCQFLCSCGKVYDNGQAVKVHAMRHKHTLPKNYIVKVGLTQTQPMDALPAIQLMAAVALSELCKPVQKDAEVQTDPEEKQKRKQISPSKLPGLKRRKSTTSQETQTQSTSSSILKRAMLEAKIPVRASKRKRNTETQTIRKTPKKPRKSMKSNETQTAKPPTLSSGTQSMNQESSYEPQPMMELKSTSPLLEEMSKEESEVINDVALPDGWINQKSTQTMPFDYPSLDTLLSDYRFQSSETQTDLFDENFLNECEASLSINTETQTCEELNESLENMLYSNMCTQTCDELLSSLDFVDIETQTLGLN
ncbi:uncharacterized protein LOC132202813 [Neocloeon triangulifer]|uniref:uncharacterized protein LOC132202813 n=1 Tax=Neocloeon triangulifer TaxID=2078957 RepID=UPI00286F5153|nr:uncharacterized protein LOC132202813 [Neocloeon triangulifer]